MSVGCTTGVAILRISCSGLLELDTYAHSSFESATICWFTVAETPEFMVPGVRLHDKDVIAHQISVTASAALLVVTAVEPVVTMIVSVLTMSVLPAFFTMPVMYDWSCRCSGLPAA